LCSKKFFIERKWLLDEIKAFYADAVFIFLNVDLDLDVDSKHLVQMTFQSGTII